MIAATFDPRARDTQAPDRSKGVKGISRITLVKMIVAVIFVPIIADNTTVNIAMIITVVDRVVVTYASPRIQE